MKIINFLNSFHRIKTFCSKKNVWSVLHIGCITDHKLLKFILNIFSRLTQEFAGLGGNIGFFKNELEVQVELQCVPENLANYIFGDIIESFEN